MTPGVRGRQEGEFYLKGIVDTYYCSTGSQHHEEHPQSCSLIRFKVRWTGCGEKDDTWEPIEHFKTDVNGNNTLMREHFCTFHKQRRAGQAAMIECARMTADAGTKVARNVHRELKGYCGDGNVAHFRHCMYGSDGRTASVGMDRQRYKMLMHTVPACFVKITVTTFEAHCASDVYQWFERCVPPPALPDPPPQNGKIKRLVLHAVFPPTKREDKKACAARGV